MKKRVFTRAATDPESLIELLAVRLGVRTVEAQELVASGAVYVAGGRVTRPAAIAVGDKIAVYTGVLLPKPPPFSVVHRDHWIAVVDKPAGLASQAERSQQSTALDAQVQRALGGGARLMHRLDKEASGLVLFALHGRACAPLQAAMATGAIDRGYLAIVDGELRGEGVIRLRIGRHPRDRRLRATLPEQAPAGEPACSRYRVLAHGELRGHAVTAVELRLETGRTHQLRVHLAGIGHPIVGDVAYGGTAFERMCLHACSLELPHPLEARHLRLSARVPDSFARLVPGLTSAFT